MTALFSVTQSLQQVGLVTMTVMCQPAGSCSCMEPCMSLAPDMDSESHLLRVLSLRAPAPYTAGLQGMILSAVNGVGLAFVIPNAQSLTADYYLELDR